MVYEAKSVQKRYLDKYLSTVRCSSVCYIHFYTLSAQTLQKCHCEQCHQAGIVLTPVYVVWCIILNVSSLFS